MADKTKGSTELEEALRHIVTMAYERTASDYLEQRDCWAIEEVSDWIETNRPHLRYPQEKL